MSAHAATELPKLAGEAIELNDHGALISTRSERRASELPSFLNKPDKDIDWDGLEEAVQAEDSDFHDVEDRREDLNARATALAAAGLLSAQLSKYLKNFELDKAQLDREDFFNECMLAGRIDEGIAGKRYRHILNVFVGFGESRLTREPTPNPVSYYNDSAEMDDDIPF